MYNYSGNIQNVNVSSPVPPCVHVCVYEVASSVGSLWRDSEKHLKSVLAVIFFTNHPHMRQPFTQPSAAGTFLWKCCIVMSRYTITTPRSKLLNLGLVVLNLPCVLFNALFLCRALLTLSVKRIWAEHIPTEPPQLLPSPCNSLPFNGLILWLSAFICSVLLLSFIQCQV